MFTKILVALNFSTSPDDDLVKINQRLFDESLILAQANHADLLLFRALPLFVDGYADSFLPNVLAAGYPFLDYEGFQGFIQRWLENEQISSDELQKLVDKSIQAGVKAEFVQKMGAAGKTICEEAREAQVDLIVMGRHGRKGLDEMILGSVSNYAIHHAHCSVLILQNDANRSS
jgi:nucleotide-binding universal stress UspA family protein